MEEEGEVEEEEMGQGIGEREETLSGRGGGGLCGLWVGELREDLLVTLDLCSFSTTWASRQSA